MVAHEFDCVRLHEEDVAALVAKQSNRGLAVLSFAGGVGWCKAQTKCSKGLQHDLATKSKGMQIELYACVCECKWHASCELVFCKL